MTIVFAEIVLDANIQRPIIDIQMERGKAKCTLGYLVIDGGSLPMFGRLRVDHSAGWLAHVCGNVKANGLPRIV